MVVTAFPCRGAGFLALFAVTAAGKGAGPWETGSSRVLSTCKRPAPDPCPACSPAASPTDRRTQIGGRRGSLGIVPRCWNDGVCHQSRAIANWFRPKSRTENSRVPRPLSASAALSASLMARRQLKSLPSSPFPSPRHLRRPVLQLRQTYYHEESLPCQHVCPLSCF